MESILEQHPTWESQKKKQKRLVYFLDKSLEVKITYMKSWLNYTGILIGC